MKQRKRFGISLGVLAPTAALAYLASLPATAQQKAFQTPTSTNNWEALWKEDAAKRKEVGSRTARRIWQTAEGSTAEHHIVTPLAKLADLDEPESVFSDAEFARWVARASRCVESRRTVILENHEDLGIPVKPGRNPMLAELIFREISPGRAEDFIKLRREKLVPAYKKAGANGIFVYHTLYGGSRRSWGVARLRDSWADMDEVDPLQQGLGEGGFRELRQELQAVGSVTEWLVLRYRPDLSYVPA